MHFLSVLQKKYNVSIFLISDLLYQQYKKSDNLWVGYYSCFFQILSLFDLYQVNNTKLPVVYIIKSKNINL